MSNQKINTDLDIAKELFENIIADIEKNEPEVYLKLVSLNRHNYIPVWRDEVLINRSAEKILLRLLSYKDKKLSIEIK